MTSDRHHLEVALEEARDSLLRGQAPIGGVLVDGNGKEMERYRSYITPAGDGDKKHANIKHVELTLIQYCQERIVPEHAPYTLYVTLEPCHMCMGAAIVARLDRVVWLLDDYWGGATRVYDTSREYIKMRMPEMVRTPYPDLQKQAADMWVKHLKQYGLEQFIKRMLHWQHRIEV